MWLSNLEGRRLVALIVKNDSITSCPDSPASHDNNFSQDETAKGCSRFYHHVQKLRQTSRTCSSASKPIHVAPNSPSRLILNRVAVIARIGFRWNQLPPLLSGFHRLLVCFSQRSPPSTPEPAHRIYTAASDFGST